MPQDIRTAIPVEIPNIQICKVTIPVPTGGNGVSFSIHRPKTECSVSVRQIDLNHINIIHCPCPSLMPQDIRTSIPVEIPNRQVCIVAIPDRTGGNGVLFSVNRPKAEGRGRPYRGTVRAIDDHVAIVLDNKPTTGVVPRVGMPNHLAIASVDDQIAVTLHDADTDGLSVRAGRPQWHATVVEHQVPITLIDESVAAVCRGNRLVGVQDLPRLHIVPLGVRRKGKGSSDRFSDSHGYHAGGACACTIARPVGK
jgi:hypothetical protein